VIRYQRVWVTPEGRNAGVAAAGHVRLAWDNCPDREAGGNQGRRTSSQLSSAVAEVGAPGKRTPKPLSLGLTAAPSVMPDAELVDALKRWRREQAAKEGVRAFRVLGNRTLDALAARAPRNEDELLQVPGIGPQKLATYGEALLRVIADRPQRPL
jgi:DNA helicase II / ATP-dependent DNA helicase PcrA